VEAAFHAFGVAEIYLTLWLLYGAPPPLLTAFILETTNRLITVVFKFVPLRLGVDEAGTARFTQVLGLGANTGVTLGIVRKARVLAWSFAGGLLLTRVSTAGLGHEACRRAREDDPKRAVKSPCTAVMETPAVRHASKSTTVRGGAKFTLLRSEPAGSGRQTRGL
jgi:hypothetical protein